MKRDYLITFSGEFLVFLSAILVYKLAALYLGVNHFAEYALVMKTASLIQPVLLLGLGVGVPRYMALSWEDKRADSIFIAGVVTIICMLFLFLFIILLFNEYVAFLLFGNSFYVYLILPLYLILFGLLLHSACYSYFRGYVKLVPATLLRIIHCIVPLFAIISIRISGVAAMIVIGIIWSCISVITLYIISYKLNYRELSLTNNAKELINYGARRVPGDIGMAAVLILPATLTTHIASVREAGFIAFGVSVLNMVGGLFAPIGIVLLPRASKLISIRDINNFNKEIVRIFKTAFSAGIIIVALFVIFSETIIRIYLGETYIELASILRITAIGILPLVVYTSMRSVIDAFHEKAKNTKNILLSFAVFLIFTFITTSFSKNYLYILFSLLAGLYTLGLLTLFEVKKIIRR